MIELLKKKEKSNTTCDAFVMKDFKLFKNMSRDFWKFNWSKKKKKNGTVNVRKYSPIIKIHKDVGQHLLGHNRRR